MMTTRPSFSLFGWRGVATMLATVGMLASAFYALISGWLEYRFLHSPGSGWAYWLFAGILLAESLNLTSGWKRGASRPTRFLATLLFFSARSLAIISYVILASGGIGSGSWLVALVGTIILIALVGDLVIRIRWQLTVDAAAEADRLAAFIDLNQLQRQAEWQKKVDRQPDR